MRTLGVAACLFLSAMPVLAECLPDNIRAADVVGHKKVTTTSGRTYGKKVTVKETLKILKSRCVSGRLVDHAGREIRFYRVQGCWGNPPADYLEIMDNQRKEIAALKKRYTVVEMTCNPGGTPLRSIH